MCAIDPNWTNFQVYISNNNPPTCNVNDRFSIYQSPYDQFNFLQYIIAINVFVWRSIFQAIAMPAHDHLHIMNMFSLYTYTSDPAVNSSLPIIPTGIKMQNFRNYCALHIMGFEFQFSRSSLWRDAVAATAAGIIFLHRTTKLSAFIRHRRCSAVSSI